MTIDPPLLLVIQGPTASGKSALSTELALRLGTVIISADSRQFYREMKIGTAWPSPEQLQAVPHYFIGHLSVKDPYNVSMYESDVLRLLPKLFKEHRVVILCGGSGLFIRAVCEGIDRLPDPEPWLRADLKQLLATEGIGALQQKLLDLDPVFFGEVDKKNPVRLIRAIEVCITTGQPYSSLRRRNTPARSFRISRYALRVPMEELDRRIRQRTLQMMHEGLLDEAAGLYPLKHLNALQTVGYRELFSYLDGKSGLEDAVEKIMTNTRRYARRQMTWLRSEKETVWIENISQLLAGLIRP